MDQEKLRALATELAKDIKSEQDLGTLTQRLVKLTVETALNAELDEHLGYEKHAPEGRGTSNSRNGYSTKRQKRLACEKAEALAVPEVINDSWSMDFIHDQLNDGRNYRQLNVTDGFNREGRGSEVGFSCRQSVLSEPCSRFLNGAKNHALFAVITGLSTSVAS